MPNTPSKPINVNLIVNNIKKVFDNKDISILNKSAYNHITARMGFIAHYNIDGFKNHYKDVEEFAYRLLKSELSNDLSYTLISYAEHYQTAWFVKTYGQGVVNSWVDTIKGIRLAAIDFLKSEYNKPRITNLKLVNNSLGQEYKMPLDKFASVAMAINDTGERVVETLLPHLLEIKNSDNHEDPNEIIESVLDNMEDDEIKGIIRVLLRGMYIQIDRSAQSLGKGYINGFGTVDVVEEYKDEMSLKDICA